jgi:hypothetical protein
MPYQICATARHHPLSRLDQDSNSRGRAATENDGTTTKETKSKNELMQVLLAEIRNYSECPKCNLVISVAVRQNRRASSECNWYAEWIVIEGGQLKCPHALEITKQLQARFDLA